MNQEYLLSVDVVARTLWGEARGCGADGMRHVGSVILNRSRKPGWWGTDVISVCRKPYQFSCWNAGDPNRAKVEAVNTDDPMFRVALGIAFNVLTGHLADETGGADSYVALSMTERPPWCAHAVPTYADGWHQFYRTTSETAVHAAPISNIKPQEQLT